MLRLSRAGLLGCALALMLTLLAAPSGRADEAVPLVPSGRELAVPTARDGGFSGIDGGTYAPAPEIVRGIKGELFRGIELDLACLHGAALERQMRPLKRLSNLIERSGRRVVWTLGPSKSSVLADRLRPEALPHGTCDSAGLKAQRRVLDNVRDASYLPIRRLLARDKRQVFYKTDPHWTTVGGSVFSRALARRLDPKVARKQRYTYTTDTVLGAFNQALGLVSEPETAPSAVPATRVKVTTAKKSTPWDSIDQLTFDHAWDTRPAKRTYGGKTLLLGDSFMYTALNTMRPIFRHGRFLWVEHVDPVKVARAIKRSDTVVLEVLQTYVPLGQVLTGKPFYRTVERTLS